MMLELVKRLMAMEPEEFLGIARLLKVAFVTKEDEKTVPRDAAAIFEDICLKFDAMNRGQKRQMMKLVRTATKNKKLVATGGDSNGTPTENRE